MQNAQSNSVEHKPDLLPFNRLQVLGICDAMRNTVQYNMSKGNQTCRPSSGFRAWAFVTLPSQAGDVTRALAMGLIETRRRMPRNSPSHGPRGDVALSFLLMAITASARKKCLHV